VETRQNHPLQPTRLSLVCLLLLIASPPQCGLKHRQLSVEETAHRCNGRDVLLQEVVATGEGVIDAVHDNGAIGCKHASGRAMLNTLKKFVAPQGTQTGIMCFLTTDIFESC